MAVFKLPFHTIETFDIDFNGEAHVLKVLRFKDLYQVEIDGETTLEGEKSFAYDFLSNLKEQGMILVRRRKNR